LKDQGKKKRYVTSKFKLEKDDEHLNRDDLDNSVLPLKNESFFQEDIDLLNK
jgi:hypothetical protein